MSSVLHHLRKVIENETTRQLTDREALRRFAAHREESAFAALMQRHGGLVMRVCRRLLRHDQDAEDAYQATFLVLARQAGTIRQERSVASWLYGVAYRVAMKARRTAARRRNHESRAAAPDVSRPASDLGWRELQTLLDEELNRLPEKYRAPFVLCCLESRSKKEAAEDLGWKEGTVSSRLAHARKLLQQRLARRGVELTAVLAGLAVAAEKGTAMAPALAVTTLQASLCFAAGGPQTAGPASALALAWARSALRAMALARAKLPAVLLVLLALTGGAAAALLSAGPPGPPSRPASAQIPAPDGRGPAEAPDLRPDPAAAAKAQPAKGSMTVSGQAILNNGDPVPGARVALVTRHYRRAGEPHLMAQNKLTVLGSGVADGQGRFQLLVPQTRVTHDFGPTLLVSAPGRALTASSLDRLASEHTVQARLEPALSLRGRLVGPDGAPAHGVRLEVTGMVRHNPANLNVRFHKAPGPLPGWPEPTTTDVDGRFVLAGLGPDLEVDVEVRDRRYAAQRFTLRTGPAERPETAALSLSPPRTVAGRILGADTRRPLAKARIIIVPAGREAVLLPPQVESYTDADGRFRLQPFLGSWYTIWIYPAAGSPYLVARKQIRWPAGAAHQEVTLPLPRGEVVRGRVVEAGSGRPVAGAAVEYVQGPPDPALVPGSGTDWTVLPQAWDASTGPDGSFELTVFRGAGHLLVSGPTPDYLHVETSTNELHRELPGGLPLFPDGLVRLQVPPGGRADPETVTLRRGVTVRGRVVGHDGKPVAAGRLVSPTSITNRWMAEGAPVPVRDGRFELPGCDPERRVRVWIFDPAGRQGAVAEIPGRPGVEPVIRLAPCRTGTARFRDPQGKPLARPRAILELVLRDGDSEDEAAVKGTVRQLTAFVWGLYGSDYAAAEGDAGLVSFPWLIPGSRYILRAEPQPGLSVRSSFVVPHGQGVLGLGDVTFNPPRARSP
jgi:RNA polymerase sigma factor (sigma-70 family)